MTIPAPVSHAVQVLQEWLKELRDKGELADEAAAYSVLRSVLHQLRDRLTLEEAVDLGAQLPLIVRGTLLRRLAASSCAAQNPIQAEIPRRVERAATSVHVSS